ncbi:MAG: hypothetical protein AB7K09_17025 [Planctomycetota bacterium]
MLTIRIRPATLNVIGALLLTAVLPLASLHAQEPEVAAAPAETIQAYIAAVKNSTQWKVADAMRPEKVNSTIIGWKDSLGLTVETGIDPYIEQLFGEPTSDGANGEWDLAYSEVALPDGVQVRRLQLWHTTEGGEETWMVQLRDLAPINIRYVARVTLVHPLYRTLARYTEDESKLSEALSRLAGLAGADFAINSGEASKIAITCDVSNRTIAECLELVALVVGWTVTYVDTNGDTSGPDNMTFHTSEDVVEAWMSRDYINEYSPGTDIQTPLDALHHLLSQEAEFMRSLRLAITMRPNAPADGK